ncbi:MAG: four helix bundle protein [Pirellulales bacterium]|nr:four helix bundle protein [Pirellulales bacterium]
MEFGVMEFGGVELPFFCVLIFLRCTMGLKSYRDLEVWKVAMEIAVEIRQYSEKIPKSELFGLTSQIRSAALSIPSNIAEGYATGKTRVWLRHLAIAGGSLVEVETQLIYSQRVKLGNRDLAKQLYLKLQQLGKQLRKLRSSLQKKDANSKRKK